MTATGVLSFIFIFITPYVYANDTALTNDVLANDIQNLNSYPAGKIVVLIDDMGNSLKSNNAALNLPGPVSFAFLPFAHYSKKLAMTAKSLKKDVLLHAPMENIHNIALGKGGMTSIMNEADFKSALHRNIDSIPHLIGVNNHMGSKLTALNLQMRWTMEVLKERGLFFLDSKTTGRSVAWSQAKKAGMLGLKRDIFLDHDLNIKAMRRQYDRALSIARKHGYSVIIAHPHSMTIRFLQKELTKLKKQNIELISVSSLIDFKREKLIAVKFKSQKLLK